MKIQDFKGVGRRVAVMMAVSCLLCMAAFATDGGGSSDIASITTAFTGGLQTVVSNALAMIGAIAPIAIGLAGTIFLVRKAMGWFKSIAK